MDNIIRSICQNLVSNDKVIRRKGIKSVLELFKKNNLIDDLNLCKICKGLYYCLWMTDDAIQTNKISVEIVQLYKSFKCTNTKAKINSHKNEIDMSEVDNRLRYIKCLLETVSKEWPLLDKNRVDKVLLFTRILVSEILYYMNDLGWDIGVLNKLSDLYTSVFSGDNLGLLLHFIQIYLNELVMNYKHLADTTNTNGVAKNNGNNLINKINVNKNNELDGVQLLYVLKPFIVMFIKNKDKLILTTIYNYVFKELNKLNEITDISTVVYFLNYLLNQHNINEDSNTHENEDVNKVNHAKVNLSHFNHINGTTQTISVNGLNKKYIKNALKLYEVNTRNDLSADEKAHLEQILSSIHPKQSSTVDGHQEEEEDEDKLDVREEEEDEETMDDDEDDINEGSEDMDELDEERQEQSEDDGIIFEGEDYDEDYINLANLSLRRISKKRLRDLFFLNNTKRYFILIKSQDAEVVKFMNKLNRPRIKNQLFYYSLIRLKRLKLQYRFKHGQLNKIYDFNKEPKTKFNINLEQALYNIKNVKPLKSSLVKRKRSGDNTSLTSSKKSKKR